MPMTTATCLVASRPPPTTPIVQMTPRMAHAGANKNEERNAPHCCIFITRAEPPWNGETPVGFDP